MKYFRLKKQADFQKLFAKGNRAFSPSLTVVYKPSDKPYFGVSVGKRHGKSVQRNRIKRLLREAFRAVVNETPFQKNYVIVLVPKVREEYSFSTFKKHLQCIVKKNNFWRCAFGI